MSNGKTRVAVLFGGQSGEHDVSLRSARTIMGALDPAKYEVIPVGITREGRWLSGGDPFAELTAASPLFAVDAGSGFDANAQIVPAGRRALPEGWQAEVDVVFPVLHGPKGEDGTVQGLLELAGIPYVGSGVLGSAVGMDKGMTKTILHQYGLPQVPWLVISRRDWLTNPIPMCEMIESQMGLPCFVKPANMGSSVGVSKCRDRGELLEALETAARFDRRILIEMAVDARELEVSVLGNEAPVASLAGEVIPGNEFYDYAAKYIDDNSLIEIPADIDGATMNLARQLAIEAFQALDLAGLARVDFFLNRESGELLINEVNTMPGFTAISMYPKLWEASGLGLRELVDRLIELAFERHADRA